MDEIQERASRRRRNTQIALRQIAFGGDGKLNPNARLVLGALGRFCNSEGTELGFPRDKNGALDPIAMARWAGRREVFDFLVREIGLKLDERHNLRE